MKIYDTANYNIRSAVPALIGRARGAFLSALDERLKPFEIRYGDYLVLVAVANEVDTASAVCTLLAHDPGAMTRKIDALEERGLVRRVRSAEDRRAIKLELTDEGRETYPKVLAVAVGLANEILHGFTKAEVRQLEDMLKRFLAVAENLDQQPEPAKAAK